MAVFQRHLEIQYKYTYNTISSVSCVAPVSNIIMRTLPSKSVPSHGLFGPHCRNPGGDQLSPPPHPGQFHSMSSVVGKHSVLSPLLDPGPNVTTDPRGEPLLPDQPPFSARRRSIATRGGIIINPPGVFSARHPGCINGNESFKFGHCVAASPDFPQEKHTMSLQSLSLALSREERAHHLF